MNKIALFNISNYYKDEPNKLLDLLTLRYVHASYDNTWYDDFNNMPDKIIAMMRYICARKIIYKPDLDISILEEFALYHEEACATKIYHTYDMKYSDLENHVYEAYKIYMGIVKKTKGIARTDRIMKSYDCAIITEN